MLKTGLTMGMLACALTSCRLSLDNRIPNLELSTSTGGIATNAVEYKPTTTASPVPSPTPPPIFFTEDYNAIPSYWSAFDTLGKKDGPVMIDNGMMQVRLDSPFSWKYQLFDPYDYEDVRVDAYFYPRGAEPSSTGVICRFSKETGWYEFTLSRQGAYSVLLGKWLAEDVAQYTPIVYDESEYIKPEVQGYELGLRCLEDELWLYINGKLIRKVNVQRYGLVVGKIGLTVASFENAPVISTFDWFKATTP